MGLYQRGVSESGASKRAEPGQFHALDLCSLDFARIPGGGEVVEAIAVRVLRSHYAGPIFRSAVDLSGDQGRFTGRVAEGTIGRLVCCASLMKNDLQSASTHWS